MDGMEVGRQISLEKLTNGLFVRGGFCPGEWPDPAEVEP